jgi:hypothetical protein
MKTIILLAVILSSNVYIFALRNQGGYKDKFDKCETKIFGSECNDGLSCLENNCEQNVCLVPTGGACENHLDCDKKHICEAGKCINIPDSEALNGRDTQTLMDIPLSLRYLRSHCKNLIKNRLHEECSPGFIEMLSSNCIDHHKCEKHPCGAYMCFKKRGQKCARDNECGPEEHCRDKVCSGFGIGGPANQWEANIWKKEMGCPRPTNYINWKKLVDSKYEDLVKMKSAYYESKNEKRKLKK